MNLKNRLYIHLKRYTIKKSYICMLLLVVILTGIYMILPAKERAASIRVALYDATQGEEFHALLDCLESTNSLYDFYVTDNKEQLITHVKSGYAECGFYFPENCYEDYINGNSSNPIILYKTPAATLASTISESVFSCMLKTFSSEILTYAVDIPEYNQELIEGIKFYLEGDAVFHIEALSGGDYSFQTETYHVDIPVYEICILLIIFSSLLGLLTFLKDKERNLFVAISSTETFSIKVINLVAATLPITLVGLLSSALVFGICMKMVILMLISILTIICTLFISVIIRKSTLLSKVLPLIMLICLIVLFTGSLL